MAKDKVTHYEIKEEDGLCYVTDIHIKLGSVLAAESFVVTETFSFGKCRFLLSEDDDECVLKEKIINFLREPFLHAYVKYINKHQKAPLKLEDLCFTEKVLVDLYG